MAAALTITLERLELLVKAKTAAIAIPATTLAVAVAGKLMLAQTVAEQQAVRAARVPMLNRHGHPQQALVQADITLVVVAADRVMALPSPVKVALAAAVAAALLLQLMTLLQVLQTLVVAVVAARTTQAAQTAAQVS